MRLAFPALMTCQIPFQTDNHLNFGCLGAQYVPNALAAHGRAAVAYSMLTQTTPPSYGWQIVRGATTLWETWDGTGSQSGLLNHTFFGDVNAWMMKTILINSYENRN